MSLTSEDDELDQPQLKPRGGWKKFLLRFAIVVGVLVAVWIVSRWQIARVGERRLGMILDRIEVQEPPWKIEDIEADRQTRAPSPERNSAPVVLAAAEQIPAAWDKWRQEATWMWDEQSNHLPTPERVAEIRAQSDSTIEGRTRSLTLCDFPTGYRPCTFPDNPIALSLPHLDTTSRVVSLLHYEAMLAAIDGEPDRGIRAAHAALNAARSIGDEPTLISQLFRMANRRKAAQIALQTLAWGTPTHGLGELQAALIEEADEPLFLVGIRGERAGMHRLFVALESGRLNSENALGPLDIEPAIANPALFKAYRPLLYGDHAEYLRLLTAYVDAAKLPWLEQRTAVRAVLPNGPSNEIGHSITRLILPACDKFVDAGLKGRAKLLTSAVALACERYRQQTGHWPRKLDEIPKTILLELPVSPFDGRPLRYTILPDGVAVSCFCPDEKMNVEGPAEFREPGVRGFAEGARLWNPEARGLPPEKPKDENQP